MIDRILLWVRVVAVVNFALLGFGAFLLGGDAFCGYTEGGHYFLGSAGRFVEVSHGVWMYSRIHMISNFVTFGLAVAALTLKGFREIMGLGKGGI